MYSNDVNKINNQTGFGARLYLKGFNKSEREMYKHLAKEFNKETKDIKNNTYTLEKTGDTFKFISNKNKCDYIEDPNLFKDNRVSIVKNLVAFVKTLSIKEKSGEKIDAMRVHCNARQLADIKAILKKLGLDFEIMDISK